MDAVRRTAVLAEHCGKKVTLLGIARVEEDRGEVDAQLIAACATLDRMESRRNLQSVMLEIRCSAFSKSERVSN